MPTRHGNLNTPQNSAGLSPNGMRTVVWNGHGPAGHRGASRAVQINYRGGTFPYGEGPFDASEFTDVRSDQRLGAFYSLENRF